jgi:hypothetical protein
MTSRTEPSVRRRIVKGSILLALLAGTTYALARTIELPDFELFATEERKHLDPIPIDPVRACPHVDAIHTQLEDFELRWFGASWGLDAATVAQLLRPARTSATSSVPSGTQAPWPQVESELDASAILLDATIANGIPSLPPRIQSELTKVREQIAIGRMKLGAVDNSAALNVTQAAFDEGQLHAGYASDLVGDQCPVRLGT